MLLLLASLAMAAVPLPKPKAELPAFQPEITEWCFPSGLRVQGQREPSSGLVRVVLVVGAGSADGQAHLV